MPPAKCTFLAGGTTVRGDGIGKPWLMVARGGRSRETHKLPDRSETYILAADGEPPGLEARP